MSDVTLYLYLWIWPKQVAGEWQSEIKTKEGELIATTENAPDRETAIRAAKRLINQRAAAQRKAQLAKQPAKKTSRAFLGAYLKGRRAWETKGAKARCPYANHRTGYHNGVTFSQSFIRYWREGHADAKAGRPIAYCA